MRRLSNKAVRGQSSADPRLWSSCSERSTKKHQFVQEETSARLRQQEQAWAKEVEKAHRAGADLPPEPPVTIGGFYKT